MVVFEEKIASNSKSISAFLISFKNRYLKSLSDNPAIRDRIEYVVMEAVDNAHEHGNNRDESKTIEIRCWKENDLLRISVLDEGEGFDRTISETMPAITDLNGRGLFSIQEFAQSVSFNEKGNMITITFKTRCEIMTEITVSDGRVCIIKAAEITSVKEGLEAIKNALIDFTTSDRVQESKLDTFLFVDLSPFNIINSSLIGIFGSIIMDQKIQLLGLCGIQPSVKDILKRFGVITDDGMGKDFASDRIKENLSKVIVFDSIEDGLTCLNPA